MMLTNLSFFLSHQDLDNFIDAALQFYGEKKLLESTRIPLALEKDNDPRLSTSPLKFPGKLAVDVLNNRLFISDSNHNRIVRILVFPFIIYQSMLTQLHLCLNCKLCIL